MTISERQWQDTVVAAAKALSWRVYHTHDSRRSEPGFPDLVLVRDRVIFAELKTQKGKLSQAQADWLLAIQLAGPNAYVWRPSDWPTVESILRSDTRA